MKRLRKLTSSTLFPGILLLASAALALALANSPLGESYQSLVIFPLVIPVGLHLPDTLQLWVNDLLMVVFFFYVGLEIKQELLVGNLSSPRRAALPAAGAIGGMLVPALIFSIFNPLGEASKGWGIPMATDIAFSLGVLSLLGTRISPGIKIFLTALAIVDDLGAVLVIALFYTSGLKPLFLLFGLFALVALFVLNRKRVRSLLPYLGLGFVLWLSALEAGIHPTIAGVLLAFFLPSTKSKALVHMLHPWISFAIMPIFAFFNAGVALQGSLSETVMHPVGLGVILGLLIGKPLGITLFAWVACKLRMAELPEKSSFVEVFGVALLAGIGFTMALFIASLALPNPSLLTTAKLGIFIGSLISAIVGYLFLRSFDE